ncbi:MAG TPA: hypothetical protein VGO18_30980 [Steroidobacteraceae bacterium]|jgi:hypothetical protein|nr:hypothetical protein [Steroidobacteraceae bacterium]
MTIRRDLCRFTTIAMLASVPMTVTIAEPNPTAVRATAAFVNRAEMIKWVADGELGLWIQARDLKWFYARFTGVCEGVSSTNSLMFNTGASGNIDRTSSVTVPAGGRCRLRSLVPSGGPPVVFEPLGGWQG